MKESVLFFIGILENIMKIPAETVEELRHEVSEGLVLVHNFIVFVLLF